MTPTELSHLLDRLEVKASDGFATQAYSGHALSRTETSLHLAIPSGVLSIPFSEIKEVVPIPGLAPDWVTISVGNADKVTYLRRAHPLAPEQGPLMAGWLNGPLPLQSFQCLPYPPFIRSGPSLANVCADTTTITSVEGADATDDGSGCGIHVVDPGD